MKVSYRLVNGSLIIQPETTIEVELLRTKFGLTGKGARLTFYLWTDSDLIEAPQDIHLTTEGIDPF